MIDLYPDASGLDPITQRLRRVFIGSWPMAAIQKHLFMDGRLLINHAKLDISIHQGVERCAVREFTDTCSY